MRNALVVTGTMALLLAQSCLAITQWEPPEARYEALPRGCSSQWDEAVRLYVRESPTGNEWETAAELGASEPSPVEGLPTEEVRWVLDRLRPAIAHEAMLAGPGVTAEWLFDVLTDRLVASRLTHICAVEATFSGRLIRELKPYGAIAFVLTDGEPVEQLPEGLPAISFKDAVEAPALDKEKVWLQRLPGTKLASLLFYVPGGEENRGLGAWWRFVFTPAPDECVPLGPAPAQ